MISINYPEPDFQIKQEGKHSYIFDAIRKLWVPLTEEEWVRQNFIRYVKVEMHYPSALIAVEKEIALYDLKKRFDVLVYDKDFQPWMLIECKAPQIDLNEKVMLQLFRYHIGVPVTYLIITNGDTTYGWKKHSGKLYHIQEMPEL
jgi:hypothetical protein